MEPKELLFALSSEMSISGFEHRGTEKVKDLLLPYFDEYRGDRVGNHLFIRRSGKENAPRLLIDTHYDEIGLMVKGVTDDGFLRVTDIGGVDARLFPGSEVIIYGTEEITGVVAVKPGHTRAPEEAGKLVPVRNLLVDTGYSKDELEAKGITLGTPIGFVPDCISLGDNMVSGKGFDNKACCAAAAYAVSMLKDKKLGCDIYLSMSAKEEVGHRAASSAAFAIDPDYALVLDVGIGFAPGEDKRSTLKLGEGAGVSLTAHLDRKWTKTVIDCAKKNEIPVQVIVEATGTGTHADQIESVRNGIPTALLSLPLIFMHTPIETVSMKDFENTARLLACVTEEKFGEKEVGKDE